MSLDVSLYIEVEGEKPEEVYSANITHNLNKMADKALIYEACWHPYELNIKTAGDLIPLLEQGIEILSSDPEYYKQFNAPNGWGMYKHFVPWLHRYLEACTKYPDAKIYTST